MSTAVNAVSESEAATRIQTIVRGQQAQELYNDLMDAALEQEEAVICMQSVVRQAGLSTSGARGARGDDGGRGRGKGGRGRRV